MESKPNSSPRRPAHTAHTVKHPRRDDGNAFIPDPQGGPAVALDDLAEELAEQFIASATSAEDTISDDLDQEVPEELGGPFIVRTSKRAMATTTQTTVVSAPKRPSRSPKRPS